MKFSYIKRPYIILAVYLAFTVLIGLGIVFLALDRIECVLILDLQSLAQKTFGIQFFQVLTYLGDFYLWIVLLIVLFFYTCLKSGRNFNTAIELATYLTLVTVSTYLLKIAYARPRPYCTNVVIYEAEGSFSYPSGHVSRAMAILIFPKQRNRIRTALIAIVALSASLSRIVLGAHFPTDTFGAIFLSFAMHQTTKIIVSLFFKPKEKH